MFMAKKLVQDTEVFLFGKPTIIGLFEKVLSFFKSTSEEEKSLKLSFLNFKIQNYKGIQDVEIDLVKNNLVLLLGLNESGKTTILKALESFSFLNDPEQVFNPKFFHSIRKKSHVNSNETAKITATIKIQGELQLKKPKSLEKINLEEKDIDSMNSFVYHLNEQKQVVLSRVFPFKGGKPQKYYYKFESEHPFAQTKLSQLLAIELVNVCPFILYFEDFKDRIPEKIFVNKKSDSYDPIWYDIIDGLFYNTDENFSIESFKKFYSPSSPMLDDANTVETRVNKTLNETFTEKWKSLSGVKEIESAELKYSHVGQAQYFTLKVKDKDGTTYSVDERSKGALWYLSFLMKTEFRSKKLRKNSGKPVFLIDEPASNLHSTAQVNMINDFKKLAKDTSIIYTTHSQYLISLENIKNTYIIEKVGGVVTAHKWGVYLNQENSNIAYYQPLANLLNLIPNSLTVPWEKAILTEGPSDRHVLISIYRILHGHELKDVVIYPGTSAKSLSNLISLNIGWNAKFKILLDGDEEGIEAAAIYKKQFSLSEEISHLPDDRKKIEKCFSKSEKNGIRSLVLNNGATEDVSKREFASMWAIISETKEYDKEIHALLSAGTNKFFKDLFNSLLKYN